MHKHREHWKEVKDLSENAWHKTKEVSGDVWEGTKEFAEEAWETTKETTKKLKNLCANIKSINIQKKKFS